MFDNITRAQFSVDTVFPTIQTFTTLLATEALGRLGHYKVSAQSTVLISLSASLLSALANNFFTNTIYQLLAVPVSVGLGLVAHRFFYPAKALNAIANVKEIAIITAIILSVKIIADNLYRFKKSEEAVKGDVKEAVADAKEVGKKVVEEVLEVAEEAAEKIEKGLKKVEEKVKA